MKKFFKKLIVAIILVLIFYAVKFSYFDAARQWKLPFKTTDRQDFSTIYFEPDAKFKAARPSYNGIPSHFHTGVDMQTNEPGGPGTPIFAIAKGKVVQIADSPPLRRIVIRHRLPYGAAVWSVYLHIVEENVQVGDRVSAETQLARRMNETELNYFGWEYNHLHLEIMKNPPLQVKSPLLRRSFICRTPEEVDQYFYDPVQFLLDRFKLK